MKSLGIGQRSERYRNIGVNRNNRKSIKKKNISCKKERKKNKRKYKKRYI